MNSASRLSRTLSYVADRFVIGTIVLILSCPIVTVPAAFAAGVAATRETTLRAAVPRSLRAFRHHLGSGVKAGVFATALLVSSFVSVLWILSPVVGAERVAAYASALLTILTAVAAMTFSAVLLDMGARLTMRNVVLLVCASPGSFMLVVTLAAIGVVLSCVAPILALPATGVVAQVLLGVRVRYERRMLRGAMATR